MSAQPSAARIEACLKAMEGIHDPAAARVILDMQRTLFATDMLEALKSVRDYLHEGLIMSQSPRIDALTIAKLDTVIAKAEGRS